MVAYTGSPSSIKEAEILVSDLHSEFQASQDYIVRFCLSKREGEKKNDKNSFRMNVIVQSQTKRSVSKNNE